MEYSTIRERRNNATLIFYTYHRIYSNSLGPYVQNKSKMGSGVSSDSKEARKQVESKRFQMIHQVEKFVINVYACCPRIESMKLILSSEMASKAFYSFVKSERADEVYQLYVDADALEASKKSNTYQLTTQFKKLMQLYINPDTSMQVMISNDLKVNLTAFLDADVDDSEYTNQLLSRCQRLKEESIFIMARDQFHRFIVSKYYKTWRSAESSHARATTVVETSKSKTDASNLTNSIRSWSNEKKKKKPAHAVDLSVRAFINVDMKEISRLLGNDSWLASLLAAVEGLPICFSLATASKERKGFPLMYVNRYFEKVTGYQRSDAIGKNCRFLQGEATEPESINKLSEALRKALPCTVILTNRTFLGRIYKNLVSLKPIKDSKGVYRYVMAIQIDVSKEVDECVSKLKLAEGLMAMLPDTLMEDEEE